MSLISLQNRIWKQLPKDVLKHLPKIVKAVEISSPESARLNRIYRNRRTPANVLSFYYGPEYGEILVCSSCIREEARKQKHTFKYQMTWMILHGMLHLAGIHHERSEYAERRVARLEKTILTTQFINKK